MEGSIRRWGARRTPRFALALVAIAALGLVLRLSYLLAAPETLISGDGYYFHFGAISLADGQGFLDPYAYLYTNGAVRLPGAEHPPAWTVVLTLPSWLGFESRFQHQVFASLIGTATIVCVGFAGRQLVGRRTGLIAAALTALYPGFWLYERQLLSETLTLLGVALVILLALRFRAKPSLQRAALVGATCGVLALTRTEQVLLLVVLLVPLVLFTPAAPWRERIAWLVAGEVAGLLVLAPWIGYNISRFDNRVLISSNGGFTLSASNCDAAYYGPLLGYKDLYVCSRSQELFGTGPALGPGEVAHELEDRNVDPSWRDAELRTLALRYVRDHIERLPVVLLAREGRTWGVFRPLQQMRLDLIEGEIWFFRLQYAMYLALVPAAVAGAVILRRRRAPLTPLLAIVVVVVVTVAMTFGSTRYRAPADIAIVLLAAVAFDALVARRARGSPEMEPAHEELAAESPGAPVT